MTSRFRLALAAGLIALSGCSEYISGPIEYKASPLLAELKTEAGQPKAQLRQRVETSLGEVFGTSPQKMIVPKGAGFPNGGIWLAGRVQRVGLDKEPMPVGFSKPDGTKVAAEGGYALYRKHCLHCHGVTGDGQGPTAAFLWPHPRDYRPGIFKFTSTTGQKPTRADLRRILYQGIANSSMPSFEATMSEAEIEQVLDYVVFLSARGETEKRLIGEALGEEEPKDAQAESPINKARAEEVAKEVFDAWRGTDAEVLNPPIARTPSTPESVAKGKLLFLGLGRVKLECAGCHGTQAKGDGPSFVPYEMFREVVFGGDPAQQDQRLKDYIDRQSEKDTKKADALKELWTKGSLDEWGNPIRPANLNLGIYKGGRRPLDLYWRIAKGINGAKMPAHASVLHPDEIWDVVNFVLALPFEPELLRKPPASFASAALPGH